jgi:glycopeptide antibiotics resistance protein
MSDTVAPASRTIVRTVFWAYLIALALIAFWPEPVDRGLGWVIAKVTQHIPLMTYARIEYLANIALFIPLGVLLALVLHRARYLVVPLAVITTVTVEGVQAVMLDSRVPSLHDIVANVTGACVGLVAAVAVEALRARTQRHPAPRQGR